tara:strand:+ start:915 stop:1118 length:204 start_codon:yes stop_codon:yes gene_type:complete
MITYLKNTLMNLDIKTLWKDKLFVACVLIGFVIAYILFNILTSTIKYPIIIILGLIIGKLIYDSKKK